ncbi:MAG: DUF2807 domain-containing protein [Bacteroidetes bacterium]|nr:DUF2807 domain-containing protein [Bacteroidota bacterium]
MKSTLLFSGILLIGLTSCKKNGFVCYHPNGNIITEQRTTDHFDGIDLRIGADVYVEQSATYSVSITASENLMAIIKTEVHGTTLCIDTKKNKCINGDDDIAVYITAPELRKLEISGSGDIISKTNFIASDLEMNISGSGNITLDSLQTTNYAINISGSGNVKLAGAQTATSQITHISGSGDINTLNLPTSNCDIHISGSGKAQVWAISTLKADISGSGDVIYKGNPVITASASGSGEVRPY